ncbi:MAG: histidine kinase [Flavobacteriales bacterium]
MNVKIIYSSLFLFFFTFAFTQDFPSRKKTQDIKAETKKLQGALENNDLEATANSYFNLGTTFYNEKKYTESERYFVQSKELYLKLHDKKNAAKAGRALAKTQEALKKKTEAAKNYKEVADYKVDKSSYKMNQNDYGRLTASNKSEEKAAIENNVILQQQAGNDMELAESYSNLADFNLKENKPDSAISNYTQAYEIVKDKVPEKAIGYTQKIADVLVKNNQVDEAISLKEELLEKDFVKENSESEVSEYQSLANLYLTKQNEKEAIDLLKKAYAVSIEKGHTLEAQKSVKKLDSIYSAHNDYTQSLALYQDFVQQLPLIIEKDNSLLNQKLLEETTEKIQQLEEEKRLKDELIHKKNLFNYSLLGFVGILILLIAFIYYTLQKLKIRNKKIALQSLRREMNPHFIFNSLNSINQFIVEHDELEANRYLSQYSKLMRNIMEYSKDDFILLDKEIEFLTHYVELENKRFKNKFDYTIEVDSALRAFERLKIPGMLIQPHIENAVWHGLRYLDKKGFLKIIFSLKEKQIVVTIEDNGIGIEKSKEQKTDHQKQRKSRGLKNTQERIDLLNHLYKKNIYYTVSKPQQGAGVLVTIKFDK